MDLLAVAVALLLGAASESPPGPQCTPANSVRTTVTAIGLDPGRFVDRCVEVSGLISGNQIYSGRDGMYLVDRFGADGNHVAGNRVHRLGLYSDALRTLPIDHPVPGRVFGRIDRCELFRIRAERLAAFRGEPRPILFFGGYCHYHSGPVMHVGAYRIGSGQPVRLTGEAARRRFGNITFMPLDWPHRASFEALSAQFLAALRAGDRARMAALHGVDPESRNDHHRAMMASLFDDADSAWVELRRAPPSETATFVFMNDDGRPLDRSLAGGIVCYCRTRSCAGKWPISSNDTANNPAQPYSCTNVQAPPGGPTLHTAPRNNRMREAVATAIAR